MFVSREAGAPALFAYIALYSYLRFCLQARTVQGFAGLPVHCGVIVAQPQRSALRWGQAVIGDKGGRLALLLANLFSVGCLGYYRVFPVV